MAALYGAGLVAWLYGGMSPEIFMTRLQDAISLTHFKVGLKAPFMALAMLQDARRQWPVIATRIFRVSVAAEGLGAPAAVAALDKAFGQAGAELVSWATNAANEPAPPRAVVPKRTSGG